MNLFKKDNGAVSVFLVLILVPCIAFSCLFVELGRVHMSKAMANSASDLALNSLLTNYDAELNEWYGLVASCQSIEEFYDVSAEFFLRTISSQGLDEDEIFLLSDYYSSVTGDESIFEIGEGEKVISDLLRVEPAGEDSPKLAPVEEANFSKSTIIEEGVVEFMKYRAPIEITIDIIDRFRNSGGDSVTHAVEAKKNDPLVDKKTKFYEAEGELLSAAFNTYDAIRNYWVKADSFGLTNEELKNYETKINGYKTVYSNIHDDVVKNLFNTSGLTTYTRVTKAMPAELATDDGLVFSSSATDPSGNTHYYVNKARIEEHLDVVENNITVFTERKDNLATAAGSLLSTMPGTGNNSAYEIQWWVKMDKAVGNGSSHKSEIENAAKAMLDSYAAILAVEKCELDPNDDTLDSNWKTNIKSPNGKTIGQLKQEVVNLHNSYLKAGVTDDSDAYLKAVRHLEVCSNSTVNKTKIDPTNFKVTVDGSQKNIDGALSHIKTELTTMKSNLQTCIDLLNIAIDGNEGDSSVADRDKVKSLTALATLAGTYNTKLGEWKNKANGTSTQMATENQTEIASLDSEMANKITAKAVQDLETRLKNIRTQLKTLVEAIDSMKYGSSKVADIGDLSTFKSNTDDKVKSDNIPLKVGELNTYVKNAFKDLFDPDTSPIVSLTNKDNQQYDPRVNAYTNKVKIPDLLKFFKNKFGTETKANVNEQKKQLDDAKEVGATAADAAKTKERYDGGGKPVKKEYSGDTSFNLLSEGLLAPVNLISTLIDGDISAIRDDLYVTTYIMNMFSYATYDNEGRYDLVENPTGLTLKTYPTEYKKVNGSEDATGTWFSANPKNSYNKSLTNKLINVTNNVAYEAEIEYILHGKTGENANVENIKSVYSDIYGMKYALNLVSAFKNFWSGSNTTAKAIDGVALTIQSLTSGIVPVPLTKVIILPILTIFETSKDMDRLEAGFPVEIFKVDDTDWFVRVPSPDSVPDGSGVSALTSIFSGSGPESTPNPGKGFFYSDYLMVFVYMGLSNNSKADDMYERMAEVIQGNVGKATGVNDYSLKNAHTYFKLDATMQLKPLMINLPIFNQYEHNLHTNKGWCTYTVSNTRGY